MVVVPWRRLAGPIAHARRSSRYRARWTLNWRRKNKKGKAEDAGKKRTKKATKVQKAIVGMSLEDIKKKKSQKVTALQGAMRSP